MDRYEIRCSYCGVLDHYPTKHEAERFAHIISSHHYSTLERIIIFDCMAHHGRPDKWEYNPLTDSFREIHVAGMHND